MLYIFDMGGVLLHGVFEMKVILEEQGHTLDMMDLYRDDLMDSLSAGKITEDQYWSDFNGRYGTNVSSPRWGRTFNPELDDEMIKFIVDLKKDHRVVCGSNTIEAHWQHSIDRGDYFVFDEVYVSHLMGYAKPDFRFWQTILDKEGYEAEDAVFIDDFHDNVAAAGNMGIKSILFKDLKTLRSDLTQGG